jgi:outer membrane immunogenic protein
MHKLTIGIAGILAFCGTSALAADMATKAPAPVPVVAPTTWTGFYLGADVGGTWFNQNATWNPLPSPAGFGVNAITGTERGSAAIGGVHAGYNYQFSNNAVAGIEADWSGTNANGTVTQPWIAFPAGPAIAGDFTTLSTRLDWLASVRGRLGYLVTPNVLAYATGGVAWGEFAYAASATSGAGYSASVSFNQTQTGFVVGGGLEWMMTQNWLLRAEYLYYGFDSGPNVVGTAPGFAAFPSNFVWGKNNVNVMRAGLSYKF